MGLAFLLAFAAFLINAHQRRAPKEGAVQDAPERGAPLLDKGPLVVAGVAAGIAASVKFTFLVPVVAIGARRDRLQRSRSAADHRLGAGPLGLRHRLLLVRAGGDQDRRQPDPDHRLWAAAPAASRPDAARPAAALRRRPLPDRADDLPQVVLPPARQRLRAALAADLDSRRRRRRLHRAALAQHDPAGCRGGGAGDRGRLRLHAADRRRQGGLADRLLHQHALPGAGPGAGDDPAAARAAAAGAGSARLADAALPHRASTRSPC